MKASTPRPPSRRRDRSAQVHGVTSGSAVHGLLPIAPPRGVPQSKGPRDDAVAADPQAAAGRALSRGMGGAENETLRVLVADESRAQLEPVGNALEAFGHKVIALGPASSARPRERAREHRPDLADPCHVREDGEHALELIRGIVDEATCPVHLLAGDPSREFLSTTSRAAGVFHHLDSTDLTELQGHIDIAVSAPRPRANLLSGFDQRPREIRAGEGPVDGAPRRTRRWSRSGVRQETAGAHSRCRRRPARVTDRQHRPDPRRATSSSWYHRRSSHLAPRRTAEVPTRDTLVAAAEIRHMAR